MSNNSENISESWWTEWSMPIFILIGVSLLFFALTKLISKSGDYKTLVEELDSKTFGNKWVAAYELSKYVNSSHIPEEDIPWLIEQLGATYKSQQQDPRTRNFIIVTMSSINHESVLPWLEKSLTDPDPQVQFSGVVGLGKLSINFKNSPQFPWKPLQLLMHQTQDRGLKQVAIITLAQGEKTEEVPYFESLVSSSSASIGLESLHAALGLVYFNNPKGISNIREFWKLESRQEVMQKLGIDNNQYQQLQLNFLSSINTLLSHNITPHQYFIDLLSELKKLEKDNVVNMKILELLIMLKKS
ncbi:MAG: HEAT repeat domain-containing protein [Bacteriovoracaceae bacterium]|nr:HEAT repeat domain-containing protein [Bacteriovoracaceae bacterium]